MCVIVFCVFCRFSPFWLWELEWMMSFFWLMPSVRPDRTRGSHSRWGKHEQEFCLLSLIFFIKECVKACLCLWCSTIIAVPHSQPIGTDVYKKMLTFFGYLLFIMCLFFNDKWLRKMRIFVFLESSKLLKNQIATTNKQKIDFIKRKINDKTRNETKSFDKPHMCVWAR